MNVSALKEQIDRLPPAETIAIGRPLMENIVKIDRKADEIIFRSVQVEYITPYGAGSSV